MAKISTIGLIFSILIGVATAAGKPTGYALAINHVPEWGWKKGGLGVGKSIRYDIRKYPEPVAKEAAAVASILELFKIFDLPAMEFLNSPKVPFGIIPKKE
ncbi:uncharacterized protein LOC129964157 [Argiope bruennichi]|uniref:Uncharacterized protein n=1 Tax=Argiope bruennichi TaxID=94029 RepID=A0A8T0EUF6_ARGBR|nr:uncharacterized protein LOC129964157 [Argiope bruennichi]KAF8781903.1 hypothetical protein HNY73_012245 [Argiope bruennichi]